VHNKTHHELGACSLRPTYPGLTDVVQRGRRMHAGQPWTQQNHKSHGPSQAGKKKIIDEVLLKIIMESTTMESFEKGQQGKKNFDCEFATLCSCGSCMDKTSDWSEASFTLSD
jgi:hypothetical protein